MPFFNYKALTIVDSRDDLSQSNLLVLIMVYERTFLILQIEFTSRIQRKRQVDGLILLTRSSHRRCFIKKVFSKISKTSREKACVEVSFLDLQLY